MIGRTLSHYKVLEKIGEGGMGEVYLAKDTKLDREVAIKVLPANFSENKERLARFEREARLLASLNHPNIAAIHELEESDGVHFLALEHVPGETLAERIKRGPIPIDEALPLFKQIAEGLEAAHEKGVIHRDLKPANMKVTPEGKAKVLDFGLAKALAGEAPPSELSQSPTLTREATQNGVLLGTAAYMSPEQARGKAVDRRADIWAFGCCLHESLSGIALFLGDTVSDTIAGILTQEPAWQDLPSGTPIIIHSLLRRCLAKDPSHRLQHIGDARVEIEEAMTAPSKPAPYEVAAAPKKRVAIFLPVGLVGLISGAALASVVVWNLARPARTPTRDIARLDINLPENLALAGDGRPIALSPDGKTLVYVATSGHGKKLHLRSLDSLETRAIPGTEGADSPFFSPDSQWVGFFASGKLNKVSLDDSALVTLCDADDGKYASWTVDNQIIFTRARMTTLYTVPASGGTPQKISGLEAEKGEMVYLTPEVLPGSDSLIYTASTGGGYDNKDIIAFSPITGEKRTLIKGGVDPCYLSTGHLVYSRSDSLLAVPFDIERLEVSDLPVPVLQGVEHTSYTGGFGVSDEGLLVYVPAQMTPETSLVWSDRKGTLQPIRLQPRNYWAPSISPDGRRVAITTTDLIMETWILELDRGVVNRFTFEGSNHITVWTPDGKNLVFSSDREGSHNLFWKPADGSGAAERLSVSDWHQDPASWSPDGKVLALAQNHAETNWDIWLLHVNGERREVPFLVTNFDEYHPMISPDGKWLAYVSNESGRFEVYVQPFPDGGQKWLISTEGGTAPLWARDGKELFYRDGKKLFAVSVETGPTFGAEKPQLLFEAATLSRSGYGTPDYDIAPDGQRFLMAPLRTQTPRKRIHVVLNWSEELKRLVPTN